MVDCIIGIDNGLGGGISVVYRDGTLVSSVRMPVVGNKKKAYNIPSVCAILRKHKGYCYAMLEESRTYPHDGRVSAFKSGFGYGIMQAVLTALGIPFVIVTPRKWKVKMLTGLPLAEKASSIIAATREFPSETFIPDGCRKVHDGMAESALIALYGYRYHLQEILPHWTHLQEVQDG